MDLPAALLRDRFLKLSYTVDGVLARIGAAGQAGLARNQTLPARHELGTAEDPLATLIRLFLCQQPVTEAAAKAALPGLLPELAQAGVLVAGAPRSGPSATDPAPDLAVATDSVLCAAVDIRPYATDDNADHWVVSDLTPGLDGPANPTRPDYVLGVSPASTTLAQLSSRRPVASALDLGTGCGVQALHLATHADRIVATDLNPRAIQLAGWTAALNRLDLDLRLGDLYASVANERFDLIITNPPYVMAPPADTADRLTYRESGRHADDLVREVVTGGIAHLTENGMLQVLGNWAHLDGQDWQTRLRDWLPDTGVRALILERERLDPYEYIEIWLADAGLLGTPGHEPAYRRWLDYFAEQRITGVGMGWISVRRTPGLPSRIRVEAWPHAVAQPVGAALAAWLDVELPASDDELYARRWQIAPGIDAETLGRPGADDPEHLIFRQRGGLRRAVATDTALAAVLGACDGELPLEAIVAAVGQLLGADPAALRAELAPRLRGLIEDGFLV